MKFEIGKRYEALSGSSLVFEIVKRTATRITYVAVQHADRYNESKSEPKTATVKNWEHGEVFFTNKGATVAAFE